MIQWHSRLSLLSDVVIKHKENDESAWICFDDFMTKLKENGASVKNLWREVKNYSDGVCDIEGVKHISVHATIRYIFQHADKDLIYKRIMAQVMSVLVTNTREFNYSSNQDVYNAIAGMHLHNPLVEKYLFERTELPDDIPTLDKDKENEFSGSPQTWERIKLFEHHFSSSHNTNNYTYSELISAKCQYLSTIQLAKKMSSHMQNYASLSVSENQQRRNVAEKNAHPHIHGSNGQIHDPQVIDSDIKDHLAEAKVDIVEKIVSVECSASCLHMPGIHIICTMKEADDASQIENLTALITTRLKSKHDTECSQIDFCYPESLQNYMLIPSKPERFHIRDAMIKNVITPLYTWLNTEREEQTQDEMDIKCASCYPQNNMPPLDFNTFNANQEWAVHVPLPLQILMESYLNPSTFPSSQSNQESSQPNASQQNELIQAKVQRLYFTYDLLLNTFNRKYFGLLQERNTYELIMGSRSITTVFHITSHSGATMSLNIAEVKLLARSDRESCYFSTYIQHHSLHYDSIAGPKLGQVRILDCPVKCVRLDNLVKLRYHNDPKPKEHRSQQICTIPITITGVPKDEEQLATWHGDTCNMLEECSCMLDLVFEANVSTLATKLLEAEKRALDKFKKLLTWGSTAMWEPLKLNGEWQHVMLLSNQRETSATSYSESTSISVQSSKYLMDGDLELSVASLKICSESDTSSHSEVGSGLPSDDDDELSGISFLMDLQDERAYIDNFQNNKSATTQDVEAEVECDVIEGDGGDVVETEFDLFELIKHLDVNDSHAVDVNSCEDPDLQFIISGVEDDYARYSQKKILNLYAGIIHGLSLDEQKDNIDIDTFSAVPLEALGYGKYRPPRQIVRHPLPATGRDDDIDKLKEILDDIIEKSGHNGQKGHRILCAPDNKIGANLLKLKAMHAKYQSVIADFPLLHLRKHKITILCSAYKDLGIVHMLLYMRDTKDVEWAKLIENAHIDKATRYIRRLSLALHMAFMVTFLSTLSQDECLVLMEYFASGSMEEDIVSRFERNYMAFIKKGKARSVTFTLHYEIMTHCDEVIGLAFSERLGGTEGYDLLLAVVKEALPFAFVNGSSSYALFATKLLHEHYKCGPYSKNLKASLYTGPYKDSDKNFALDTQREMEHQDVSRSFHSGGSMKTVVYKMGQVDFLVNDLQAIVKQQDLVEQKNTKPSIQDKEITDLLSMRLSLTDKQYIYRGAAMFLRKGVLTMTDDTTLRNVYDSSTNKIYSLALLDQDSLDIGRYLAKKCIAKESLFGCCPSDKPDIDQFTGSVALKEKASKTLGTTVKRSAMKLEKDQKSQKEMEEEKRQRKGKREEKKVKKLTSKMNACQAVLESDCSKTRVLKGERMKKAIVYLLQEALRITQCLPDTDTANDIIQKLREEAIFIENVDICEIHLPNIGAITCEFAGVKFKHSFSSGEDYIKYISEKILQFYLKKFPGVHHMAICEEKYKFTPDIFKGPTHKSRNKVKGQVISVDHLKPEGEIVSVDVFSKSAVTDTIEGKKVISSFLAKNAAEINTKREVILDIDSELCMSECICKKEKCICYRYAIPISFSFGMSGQLMESNSTNIKQRKGEAELAQLDWLIHYLDLVKSGESFLSIVSSGDIDAVILHMFALSHLWPRNENGDFLHQVYVLLLKPSSKDLYNITAIIRLLEKAHSEMHIAMKIAVFLTMGGNDFIPMFYNITHLHIVTTIMSCEIFKSSLIHLLFNNECLGIVVDQEVYIDLITALYCPKYLDYKGLTFEEVRQISVQVPLKKKLATETKNPQLWLPPKSALAQICQLVQLHCDYMMMAGIPDADVPDVTSCFTPDGDYNFGHDVHVNSALDLCKIPQPILFDKMSKHRVNTKRKREMNQTPQKSAPAQKRRPQTSTPKKLGY